MNRHAFGFLLGKYISWKSLAEMEAGDQTIRIRQRPLPAASGCQAGGGCLSIPLNMFLTLASPPQSGLVWYLEARAVPDRLRFSVGSNGSGGGNHGT